MGGSAGGLLMGAVANMAPELFKGIVAVPFVDVVTTMLDEDILLPHSNMMSGAIQIIKIHTNTCSLIHLMTKLKKKIIRQFL